MQPTNDLDEVLSTTRAIRKRLDLDRPVDREVVLECLRLAVQAPTGSNAQTWRWLVVTDPGLRRQLADLYNEGGLDYLTKAAEDAMDPQTKRVYESALHLTEILAQVPVLVIPCIERRMDGQPTVAVASAYGSILPAAWSFLLALRSRGLGSVWTTLHLWKEKEAAELLGIPDTITQVAMFPVAHITGDTLGPAERPPVEGITYWDRWGATEEPVAG